jgi:SPP1 gp7 family putative phage head morphogenesis protein
MQTRSNSYWEKRANARMKSYHKATDRVVHTITQAYNKAIDDLNKEIQKIYDKFAIDGNLSPVEARQLLNSTIHHNELDELRKQVLSVQDEDIKKYLMSRLNTPAYKARMTRLEALKEKIYIEARKLATVEINQSRTGYIDTVKRAYYSNIYDLQRGLGVGFDVAQIPKASIESILKNPWSGEHFSSRVWKNTDELAKKLTEVVTSGMMSGKSLSKMSKELEELSQIGKHAANRLVRTETTFMANAGEREAYKQEDIEKYIFIATLDSRTSEVCREHDGKIYGVDKAVAGKNMPPLHPYCRSTTIAYLDEDTLSGIERRAKDPETGKTHLVPANITYEEWSKKYIR